MHVTYITVMAPYLWPHIDGAVRVWWPSLLSLRHHFIMKLLWILLLDPAQSNHLVNFNLNFQMTFVLYLL